jgi:two-component system cell cycle response regulator
MIIGFNQSVSLDHLSDLILEETSDPENDIYVDPVCSNADYKYDKSSDIYSLGLIMRQISSGKIPHERNKETPVNSTPIDYIELYENAWSDDPKKRPSIEEIARSLGDIDISHVYQDSDYIPNVYLGRNNAPLKKEACLFIIKGLYDQTPYLFLTHNETFIGRTESNHIIIKDQELGKQHAKIKSFQGKVEIFDLGSKSGVYVNDKKLEFRASRTLEKDDLIKLGKAVFQYLPAGEYENRIDKLLPIYNREYLQKSLENEFENARENKQNLSLLFFDLDHFGNINKQYSHETGDYVLKELSELINKEYVRPRDIFARYGGEEFTILLNNTNVESASEIAEKIRDSVETHTFSFDKKTISVTLSIGVFEMNSSVETSTDLLNHAEEACRKAKENGRNRVVISGNEQDSQNLRSVTQGQ